MNLNLKFVIDTIDYSKHRIQNISNACPSIYISAVGISAELLNILSMKMKASIMLLKTIARPA